MHARDRAALPQGSTILVLGAGAVGLLAAAVSKADKAKAVIIADINQDRVDFAVSRGFADAGVIVPMERPQSIEDKLAFAKKVADQIKNTQIQGQAVGEVSAVYECTGVETCVQSAIYVSLHRIFYPLPFTNTDFAGYQTRRQSYDHRHGNPHPHPPHVRRLPPRSRSHRRLQIRQHVQGSH